jgi:hypothetical protein
MTMCVYQWELGDAEINTYIHRVLAHGIEPNLGVNLAPLREGVDSARVSLFAFAFGNLCICFHSLSLSFSFLCE